MTKCWQINAKRKKRDSSAATHPSYRYLVHSETVNKIKIMNISRIFRHILGMRRVPCYRARIHPDIESSIVLLSCKHYTPTCDSNITWDSEAVPIGPGLEVLGILPEHLA